MPGWSRRLIVARRSRIACTIPWTPSGEHRHERSRPQYQSDAGEPALRRKNPFRRLVPLAGGARQKALPHARRCAGVRRAKGKPERAPARPVHQGRYRRAKTDSGLVGRSAKVLARDEMICFSVCFRRTWSHDERWHLTVSSTIDRYFAHPCRSSNARRLPLKLVLAGATARPCARRAEAWLA